MSRQKLKGEIILGIRRIGKGHPHRDIYSKQRVKDGW